MRTASGWLMARSQKDTSTTQWSSYFRPKSIDRGRVEASPTTSIRRSSSKDRPGHGSGADSGPANCWPIFFIHTAEAEAGEGGRSYEFLHATFADYLIAHHTAEQLRDLHAALSRPSFQQWDDDLAFALLSHRLLAASGARTLDFLRSWWEPTPPSQQFSKFWSLKAPNTIC